MAVFTLNTVDDQELKVTDPEITIAYTFTVTPPECSQEITAQISSTPSEVTFTIDHDTKTIKIAETTT